MYRKKDIKQIEFEDFYLPFGGKLRSDNRWVKLAKILPWEEIEKKYEIQFSKTMGAPAKPLRMALGSLIIKEKCTFSDEETVEQICENPYLQYFIGLKEYSNEAPFDPSMMVYFRKRINLKLIREINEMIIFSDFKNNSNDDNSDVDNDTDDTTGTGNKGKLILDATCTPADIRYPTDLSLLNEGREKLEEIIDVLHEPLAGKEKKPRTYREKAHKLFLKIIKRNKKSYKEIRKAIGKQLRFISRNLTHIQDLIANDSLKLLTKRQFKNLLVVHELYHQQKTMYDNNSNRIDGRIVSISQPHVRPIVRGKASAPVEFGAKLALSMVDGYSRVEALEWESFNESTLLKNQIEMYKERYGYYPESVHVDKLYRNRININFCKNHGIRISGPPMGRPKTEKKENSKIKLEKQDLTDRVAIEGKFGEGKRRYGLSRIMAKLPVTSESVIGVIVLIMNLERRLRLLLAKIRNAIFVKIDYKKMAILPV